AVDANDARHAAPGLVALARERGDAHDLARGGEHGPALSARGEVEVGRQDTRVDAAHRAGRPALLLTKRCGNREDLLPARDGWRAAARAAKRHGPDRRHDHRVDADDREVALRIGFEDAP